MRVYYAHGKNLYGTPTEARDITLLETLGFEILNPNTSVLQEGCTSWPDGEMDYFYRLVVQCDVLAFRALPSGEIPAGVAGEIRAALRYGVPVIELPNRTAKRSLTVEETREYFRDCGER